MTGLVSHSIERRKSIPVKVGTVTVGGDAPIVVQSMTNTDTADVDGTVAQVEALHRAGSELVRITVEREEAAQAVPYSKEKLLARGVEVPIVGDFHYIGHKLLTSIRRVRKRSRSTGSIPATSAFGRSGIQFSSMIETALEYDRPVRIGVNWGSLDQELLVHMMDENGKLENWPLPRT